MLGWRKAMAQIGQRRTIEEFSFARRGIDRASTPGRAIRGCAAVAILPGPYSQRKGTLSAVKTLTGVGHKFLPRLSQI